MPLRIIKYRCKYCGRQYDSYTSAKICEDKHLTPVSVKAELYTVAANYPYKVEVTLSNGERRIYNAADLGG